jgi:hypothetical protein
MGIMAGRRLARMGIMAAITTGLVMAGFAGACPRAVPADGQPSFILHGSRIHLRDSRRGMTIGLK